MQFLIHLEQMLIDVIEDRITRENMFDHEINSKILGNLKDIDNTHLDGRTLSII